MAKTGSAAGSALGDWLMKIILFAVDALVILFVLAGVVAVLGSLLCMLCDAHKKDRLGVLAFACFLSGLL